MFINTNSLLVVVDMQRNFVTGVLGMERCDDGDKPIYCKGKWNLRDLRCVYHEWVKTVSVLWW